MTMGKDRASNVNMVLREDHKIKTENFECYITCNHCMTRHTGMGFVRDGEFKGIYEYKEDIY